MSVFFKKSKTINQSFDVSIEKTIKFVFSSISVEKMEIFKFLLFSKNFLKISQTRSPEKFSSKICVSVRKKCIDKVTNCCIHT